MSKHRAIELMASVNEWGRMHIIASDGNVSDGNLDFVESWEPEKATSDEIELISLLRGMSEDERFSVWEKSK
jgi:hypothetical protein